MWYVFGHVIIQNLRQHNHRSPPRRPVDLGYLHSPEDLRDRMDKHSGSMKITTRMDHISHFKTASGTTWSNKWTLSSILAAFRPVDLGHLHPAEDLRDRAVLSGVGGLDLLHEQLFGARGCEKRSGAGSLPGR